jgi:hypothetical protein
MQVTMRVGIMAWRVSQNHNIKRFNRFKRISYQGHKITSMGKIYQKSDDGRKREVSNARVRGLLKCPALNRIGSTLKVSGSFTEVKRKTSVKMETNRNAITKSIGLLELESWAQELARSLMRLMSGGTTYRKSTKTTIFLCSGSATVEVLVLLNSLRLVKGSRRECERGIYESDQTRFDV